MSENQNAKKSLKKWENEGGSLAPKSVFQNGGIPHSPTGQHVIDSRVIAGLGDATRPPLHFSQAMLKRLLNSKGEYS